MHEYLLISFDAHTYNPKKILLRYEPQDQNVIISAVRDIQSLSFLCDQAIIKKESKDQEITQRHYEAARSKFFTKYNFKLQLCLSKPCDELLLDMLHNLNVNVESIPYNTASLSLFILDGSATAKPKLINLSNGVSLDASKWIIPDKKHD